MFATQEEARAAHAGGVERSDRIAVRGGPATQALEALYQAFSRQGGVLSAEEAALLMRPHCAQPVSQLARWIVASNIVSFDSQGSTWLPLFQFDQRDMSIQPTVTALMSELVPLLEGDELAAWFVSANDWLSGASPLELIDTDFSAVLKAARADRFVMKG